MEKRIKINSIQIKNFRSIRQETIKPKDLNIFVGTNDAGKSNILKALNLFFNNETDYNTKFDFKKDFTLLFPKTSHSTKEIKIAIKFDVPDSYSGHGIFTWTKIWRTDGYYAETLVNSKGEAPAPKSRVRGALNKIKYRYVPAVKSSEYYKTLLVELYWAVSESLGNPVINSAADFAKSLKKYTNKIGKEVNERIGMTSELSIPDDLNKIFQSLIFETYADNNKIHVPLNYRGDGIQARHIPIILNYIAQENQKSRNQGSVKICTIWGFEEPENGMELSNSFAMANDFLEYSNSIQIFTTSHSPAFYMKKNEGNTYVAFVSKKEDTEQTIITNEPSDLIFDKMGLMPLVAPFIAEQESQVNSAKKILNSSILIDLPTIIVEGKYDVEYLKFLINRYSPSLNEMINNNELRIIENGGCVGLSNWVNCCCYAKFKSKMVALLDHDSAGKKIKNEIVNSPLYKTNRCEERIKVMYILPSKEIKEILTKVKDFEFEMEHLVSFELIRCMIDKKYYEKRDIKDMKRIYHQMVDIDKSILEVIDSLFDDSNFINVLKYCPKDNKKENIYKCIVEQKDTTVTDGFLDTIKALENIFIL